LTDLTYQEGSFITVYNYSIGHITNDSKLSLKSFALNEKLLTVTKMTTAATLTPTRTF